MGSHPRFGLTLLLIAAACMPDAPEPATLVMTPEKSAINGRLERAIIRLRAFEVGGTAGTGVVTLTPAIGRFIEGNAVNLVDGRATVSFRCDPSEVAACAGEVRVGASWNGLVRTVLLRIEDVNSRDVKWRVVPTGSLSALTALATWQDDVFAVGTKGAFLRLSGATWSTIPSNTTNDLSALWVTTTGDVVLAGAATTLVRYRGGTAVVSTFDGADDFTGVWARTSDDVFLSTSAGRVVHFDGASFSAEQVSNSALHAIDGDAQSAWAVDDVKVHTFNGTSWSDAPNPAAVTWTRVRVFADRVYVLGSKPTGVEELGLLFVGPTPWKTAMSGPRFVDVAATAEGVERMGVTADDVYLQRGDSAWVSLQTPMGGAAIVMRRDGDAVVVGAPGVSLLRVQ